MRSIRLDDDISATSGTQSRTAKGDVIVVRWADDFVVGFEHQSDAARFHQELAERFAKFKLKLHPEKTRVIEFGYYAAKNRKQCGQGKPETFNFLGFTHICGKKRSNGMFKVWRRTMSKRRRAKLKAIKWNCASAGISRCRK